MKRAGSGRQAGGQPGGQPGAVSGTAAGPAVRLGAAVGADQGRAGMMTTTNTPQPITRTPGPPMMGHDAATLPVDAYCEFVAKYGMEPERIERSGGAVLVGPLPERGQGDG